MTHFVLVPGAWLGAWSWARVESLLNGAGHTVTGLTLSGLADRREICVGEVGQATHVADIVAAVGQVDHPDVVLVGHSYSGIPVGQAAVHLQNRLNRVIYVDANLAHDDESFIGGFSERGQNIVRQQISENGGYWPPLEPADFAGQDLTDDMVEQVVDRSTPHPGRTLTEPARLQVSLAQIPSTYVKCLMAGNEPTQDVQDLLKSDLWELKELNTGHWPMLSKPEDLVSVLEQA